jgi:hypothetical protein
MLAQFFYMDKKIKYEQFLEIIDCRLCRMEMGRRVSWRYCGFYYSVLVAWLYTLLTLSTATLTITDDKIVLIFFLIINKRIEIAAGTVVTGSLPAAVIFFN